MDADVLLARLKGAAHENWRLKPYDDETGHEITKGASLQGAITIAAGVNLSDGLSEAEANWLTLSRIAAAAADLNRNCPWWTTLSETRQQVLAELDFMMGWPVLSGFHEFLAKLQVGNTSGAAEELLNSEEARKAPARMKLLASAIKTNSF